MQISSRSLKSLRSYQGGTVYTAGEGGLRKVMESSETDCIKPVQIEALCFRQSEEVKHHLHSLSTVSNVTH